MHFEKNELLFYSVIAIATVIDEIANNYGAGICSFLPLMLIIIWVGLKVFPKEEKPKGY